MSNHNRSEFDLHQRMVTCVSNSHVNKNQFACMGDAIFLVGAAKPLVEVVFCSPQASLPLQIYFIQIPICHLLITNWSFVFLSIGFNCDVVIWDTHSGENFFSR